MKYNLDLGKDGTSGTASSYMLAIFPKELYPNGYVLPDDMEEPEIFKNRLTLRGLFNSVYPIRFPRKWKFESAKNLMESFSNNNFLKYLPPDISFSNVTQMNFSFNGCKKLIFHKNISFNENVTLIEGAFRNCFLIEKLPDSLNFKNVKSICEMCYNCKNLKHISSKSNFSNVHPRSGGYLYASCARNSFFNTQLDKQSTLIILNTIGSILESDRTEENDFPLHIGIHVDYQFDQEVIDAISFAEEKGWNLSVQFNGSPSIGSSSLYSLRKKRNFCQTF